MNSKRYRQRQILEAVESEPLRTQGQIIAFLKKRGIVVSQSTLSKDLRDLGVVKVPTDENGFRYSVSRENVVPYRSKALEQQLKDSLLTFEDAGNLLLLKTPPGGASSLALAIDSVGWDDVLGTIAGDDTVLVVSKTSQQTKEIMRRIEEMLNR